jgi:5-methylcytosine-specific restriction enzyme subunit McrC
LRRRRTQHELAEYEGVDIEMSADAARDLIRVSQGRVSVTPASAQGFFRVQAQQYVGTVVLPEFDLLIRPKVTIDNLLYLLGIGIPASSWLPEQFRYATTKDLLAAFAEYYARATRAAIARGLLRSYKQQRERVAALRGRLDFPALIAQPARHFPVPCAFDDYTADIIENRVLRAAIGRLLRLVGVPVGTRSSLLQLLGRFEEVADELPNLEVVDRLVFTRLNAHYEASIKLAGLVLRGTSLADRAGRVAASAFLIDMNDVFQRFLTAKLREALRGRLVVESEPRHHLAVRRQIDMYPDLVFRAGGRVAYVGDAKYKVTTTGRALNSDYYQLLAYTTSLDLEEGVLVYCQSEGPVPPRMIEVQHSGKHLWTWAVSLAGSLKEIDTSVFELSRWILGRRETIGRVGAA